MTEKSLVDKFLETEEGRRQFAYEKLKYGLEEAVELLREQCQRMKKYRDNGGCLTFGESDWFYRVLKFLEGKKCMSE